VDRRAKVELFEQLRREYEFGCGTIKGTAKKFQVHRRMVREALKNAIPPERKIPERERPKMALVIAFIDAILEADRKAPRKQRHTAHRICERIRTEMPAAGVGESTVREYVRARKIQLRLIQQEVCVPQSYAWGSEAQVDWYEAQVELGGEGQKVYIFCLRSMASGGAFHRAYPHASQQAFLEAHELAFDYFGGVFARQRYDNLTSAVKKVLRGYQREETERFIAFRSHWGFQAEFCTPGEGHEKGGVEGENGYFRRNHLVPVPVARDLEELNEKLLQASREDERRVIAGRTQTVGAAMKEERLHLQPLAEEGFDLAGIHFPLVNNSGCAKVLTNFYSAPVPVGVEVEVKAYAAYVEIWQGGKMLARHERCFGRHQKVLNLEHYLEVLSRKPGALAGSTPLEQWRQQGRWPASYDQFWEQLRERRGKQEGTRAMVEVLLLGRDHGWAELESAVGRAIAMGSWDVATVRYLLKSAQEPARAVNEPVDIGGLSRYERPQPTLANYDQLLETWSGSGVVQ
jgi:transposase